jgi:hypothetical protein
MAEQHDRFRQALGEVGADVLPASSPLGEHGHVIAPPLQRSHEREVLLDAPPALHDFLCFGLVVPERRIGDRLFDVR